MWKARGPSLLYGTAVFLLGFWLQTGRLQRLNKMDKSSDLLSGARLILGKLSRRNLDLSSSGWPEFIESLAITASSGIDLFTAFESAINRTNGRLSKELNRVYIIAKSGVPLSLALKMSPYNAHFSRLADSLQRGEILGTPMSSILLSLAEESRALEKNKMLSRFNALPLKLSVVTVAFLLPPVIIVTVMPNILMFLDTGW